MDALLCRCLLQDCSALSPVCPNQQDSVRQDITVLLDQPALMAPSIRCCSSLLPVVMLLVLINEVCRSFIKNDL